MVKRNLKRQGVLHQIPINHSSFSLLSTMFNTDNSSCTATNIFPLAVSSCTIFNPSSTLYFDLPVSNFPLQFPYFLPHKTELKYKMITLAKMSHTRNYQTQIYSALLYSKSMMLLLSASSKLSGFCQLILSFSSLKPLTSGLHSAIRTLPTTSP